MQPIETQVGQILIYDRKHSNSFVFLFSEKNAETGIEIFVAAEAELLNPAAYADYEKIAKSLADALKKNSKRENPNYFENSISQANEELGKLVAIGQTSWVGKLNACLAARLGDELSIATTGKIHAYLFRDKQFTDLADSPAKPNPLKTFENLAVGKIQKNDYLIITSREFFNYVSIDRLQKILADLPLTAACETLAGLIKNVADENIAFATFIIEFTDNKFTALPVKNSVVSGILAGAGSTAKNLLINGAAAAKSLQMPKVDLKKIDPKKLGEQAKHYGQQAKSYADVRKLKDLPKIKRYFLIAALVCFVLLIADLIVAGQVSKNRAAAQKISSGLTDIQNKIDTANTDYIYKDQADASNLLQQAQNEYDALPKNIKAFADQQNRISTELTQLAELINHIKKVTATQLFTAATNPDAIVLIKNTVYAINKAGDVFMPYNLSSNSKGQDFTLSAQPIQNISTVNNLFVFEDKNGQLYQADPNSKTVSNLSMLSANNIGLAFYGAPTKAYTVDPLNKEVIDNSLNSSNGPIVYTKSDAINNSISDLAIDSSVYLLSNNGIIKYTAKEQKSFTAGVSSFSTESKLYTSPTAQYLYVLDPGKNTIYLLDKKTGAIVSQIQSDQFKNPSAFTVNEAANAAYVINGSTVFMVSLK